MYEAQNGYIFSCACLESTMMEDDEDKEEPSLSAPKPVAAPIAHSAIDVTAEFLRPLLDSENVANLVSRGSPKRKSTASSN